MMKNFKNVRFMDRFVIINDLILSKYVWNDLAELVKWRKR